MTRQKPEAQRPGDLVHVHAARAGGWAVWHSVYGPEGLELAGAALRKAGDTGSQVPDPDMSWLPSGAASLRRHALACGWAASVTRIPQPGGGVLIRVIASHQEKREAFTALWAAGKLTYCGGTTSAQTLRAGRAWITAMQAAPVTVP